MVLLLSLIVAVWRFTTMECGAQYMCDDGFSSIDATVACRQLGYSGHSRYGNVGTLG